MVAVYRPPSRTFDPRLWQRSIDSLSNFNNIFIGGDFNCHNTIWGSSHTCQVGHQIPQFFLDNSFRLLNDGSPTFLNKANSGSLSNIDHSFVSPQLFSLTSWNVLDDNFLSDHVPISISLHFNFKKASKLHLFEFSKELLSFSFTNAPTSVSSPLEKYDYLSSTILQAASTLSAKLNPNPRPSSHKPPPAPRGGIMSAPLQTTKGN